MASPDAATVRHCIWYSRPAMTLRCPACGAVATMEHIVSTAHAVPDLGQVHFHRCPDCGSLNVAPDQRFTDYDHADSHTIESSFTDHYVEIGAGIESLARLAERAGARPGASLLDVGCGFGHTLDYWAWSTGGEAIGLEPSGYGAAGRDLLGVRILSTYLANAEEIRGRRFDAIISSEVIEHVPDPLAFATELRAFLAPGGHVALTTPDAGFVRPEAPEPMVLAALSPGLHRILFSAAALEGVLRAAGYPAVEVVTETERLIAFAGDAVPESLPDHAAERARYIAYLRARCGEDIPRTPIARGLAYRCFKELVNEGRIAEAQPYGWRFATGIAATFGYDVLDAAAARARVADLADWRDYGHKVGFATPCFVFYAAMAARQGAAGFGDAAMLFDLAADLCAHCVAIDPLLYQEAASLHWVAVFERALCWRDAGRGEEALRDLDWILSDDPATRPPGCGAASAELRGRAAAERKLLAPAVADPREPVAAAVTRLPPRIALWVRRIVPVPLRPAARRIWRGIRR